MEYKALDKLARAIANSETVNELVPMDDAAKAEFVRQFKPLFKIGWVAVAVASGPLAMAVMSIPAILKRMK